MTPPLRNFIAALVLLSPLALVEATAEKQNQLPFTLYHDYLIVAHGSIGRSTHLSFLIDTGAVPSVVDQRIAERLDLPEKQTQHPVYGKDVAVKETVLPELTFGPIRVNGLPAIIGDLKPYERMGTRIDAIIGLDVLRASSFTIDYRRKVIRFSKLRAPDSGVAFEGASTFLVVPVMVSGVSLRLVLDTGARELILFQKRITVRLPEMQPLGEKSIYHMGGESRLTRTRLGEVQFGKNKWMNVIGSILNSNDDALPNADGILGPAGLGLHKIAFDFERNAFTWEGK